ncbi:putative 3-methyladenine DNA glycosylase [Dyadobacter beijingensis]|uniref:Putative 3-methyladenine DNA glycosylase n=1 Tax=Dyadobacter beijingensis TaxID=365489 RepID=A0ABQ2HRT0_9BACT|nr:DNA-3-methyladenine glycosylase [Dyadobacter beijingensis]GGM88902.1 putative 3-methyladenine DNA glycosylase [Dyadobacter beijingensis]
MPEDRLPLSFYSAYDTRTLAQKLLGCELVHESEDGVTSGIIVETEAYLQDDPACHAAFNRRTARTEPMFGVAGTVYVYLIYGMYQCFNVVSNAQGVGEAVLVRALQPTTGMGLMELRRQLRPGKIPTLSTANIAMKELCRGPGKLVRAMGIERETHNGTLLSEGNLYIRAASFTPSDIIAGPRIGINVGGEFPYRYYIKDNIFVSKG